MSEHEDENITSDHEKLPTHEFMVRKSTIQTGPRKGEERILVSLVITPYVFKQKSWKVVEEVKDIQKLMILVMILFLVFPLLRLQNTAGRCHT